MPPHELVIKRHDKLIVLDSYIVGILNSLKPISTCCGLRYFDIIAFHCRLDINFYIGVPTAHIVTAVARIKTTSITSQRILNGSLINRLVGHSILLNFKVHGDSQVAIKIFRRVDFLRLVIKGHCGNRKAEDKAAGVVLVVVAVIVGTCGSTYKFI